MNATNAAIQTPHRDARLAAPSPGARLHLALDYLFHQKKPADREAVCHHGITGNQWTLLHTLACAGQAPLPMGILARCMRLTPSGVTRCAEPLVERGLVERCMQADDRRVCCLGLSEAGAALHADISESCAAEDGALLNTFPPAEREEIVRAVEKLARAAEEASS